MGSESKSKANPKFALDCKYHGLEDNIWLSMFPGGSPDEVVNLGQGFPDYQPAERMIEYLAEVCKPNGSYLNHQYARAFGQVRLVKALANLYGPLVNQKIDPLKEVLVTGGAYGALFYAIMSNVGKGDEVIIIEPYFDCYESMVKLAGGTSVFIPLRPTDDKDPTSASWKLDMKEFEAAFNERTKAIIINSPNNPLGKVFSRDELTDIGNLCKKFNVLIISDEVYEWIVYDGKEHVRIAALDGLWDRTITIGSAGKTFSLTGWKLGWAYGPEHLMQNLNVAHQNCTYMCQTPEQEALATALEIETQRLGTPDSYFYQMTRDLTEKRRKLVESLREVGSVPVVPEGGYFIMTNWRTIGSQIDLSKETQKDEDYKFVTWLWREKKLLGIPPSAFYSEGHKTLAKDYIRFNFYKKDATLLKADKILKTLK